MCHLLSYIFLTWDSWSRIDKKRINAKEQRQFCAGKTAWCNTAFTLNRHNRVLHKEALNQQANPVVAVQFPSQLINGFALVFQWAGSLQTLSILLMRCVLVFSQAVYSSLYSLDLLFHPSQGPLCPLAWDKLSVRATWRIDKHCGIHQIYKVFKAHRHTHTHTQTHTHTHTPTHQQQLGVYVWRSHLSEMFPVFRVNWSRCPQGRD